MRLLHEIFEARAAARPADPAVVHGVETATYSELDARANRFARYLRRRGVSCGTSVAMLLPRSIDAYASILGILKAGAAYVPIDPAYPPDRVSWIVKDSAARVVLTAADLPKIAGESSEALPTDPESAVPNDLCYVIYTSGSTGRPKGVMVEHRNACHLVHAEREIFGVHGGDRVFQGASLCFDLSVEEMWLAFAAGAALIAAGPDPQRQIADQGVTVLSCVPTFLTLLGLEAPDLPALRLLILGGERCSKQLVERWGRPGRRIVNTYGPTETTVIATYADVSVGAPVTIGRPIPGYDVYFLDDNLRPVPPGETGEICIAGAGVARGYVGLPAETGARFIDWPESAGRIYRSGDLGRTDDQGNIEFMGRADGQVKLRGLRVELGEIESALLADPRVAAAVCVVHENAVAGQQLVGYVVAADGNALNAETLRAGLRRWLPAWMVPSVIEIVNDLPRLPSGKLDRATLSARTPGPRQTRKHRDTRLSNDIETRLLEVWSILFRPWRICPDDDFFIDLGGHSLLAAQMVSELRKDREFASLTVRDVYSHPTIRQLASAIRARIKSDRGKSDGYAPREPRSNRPARHFLAGASQSASLYFVFAFRGIPWVTPWLVYFLLVDHHSAMQYSAMQSALWALASAVAILPALTLIAIGIKWIVLGQIRAGRYPLWGAYYVRWWFVQTIVQSLPLDRLGGTPLLPFVYGLFGARVASNAHIATGLLAAFDVISVGDGATIDEGASLLGYTVEDGDLVIGPISVGRGCLVGTRSVLCPGAVMEDGARLEDLSLLPADARIPAGETWSGSPAKRRHAPESVSPAPVRIRLHRIAIVALYAAIVLAFPLIELAAFVPGVGLLTYFDPRHALFYLAAPLAGACFIVCVTAEVLVLKWLLIGRARPGRYPVHGWFYVRNWVVEQLLAFSLDVAGPLHATLFLKPWYRALGARLGRFVELSTASTTTPDLLDIDDDCTIADEVSLGAARVERGWLSLAATRLGRRVFVGNGAVIPAGTALGAGSLVGVLTIGPGPAEQALCTAGTWLGSPPIFLPRRQKSAGFAEQTTFRPTRKLQWARGCCEIFRVTLPGAGFVLATVGVLETALKFWDRLGPAVTLFLLPLIFAICCAVLILAVVPVKWILVGRYKPFEKPLWSVFLWRLEFVNALFEFMATPLGLEILRGTPLLSWYLRLLGCRIGREAYIDSTGFLEFDLVDVGDRAILNRDCILQTHLFEDRVLKGSWVRIGSDCEIGTDSIVLYNTEMKSGARLGALSLLMKGESLPPGPVWTGSPIDLPLGQPPDELDLTGMINGVAGNSENELERLVLTQ